MVVGTGGGRGRQLLPPIFCQPKRFKSLKIMTYKSVYSNKDKIGLVQWILEITDTNVQNCMLLIC